MMKRMKGCAVAFAAGAWLLSASAGEECAFFNDVKVPMRDGVNLAADVYLPSNRTAKVGCWLEFSPYQATASKQPSGVARAEEWGVAAVRVDCRGLCHSEGVFDAFDPQLVDDADDVLKWIAAQPWSDGRVVMTGGSYPGNTQLAAMRSGNPALVACAPSVITFDPYSINFQNGVLIPEFFKDWHSGLAGKASWELMATHATRDAYWAERSDLRNLKASKGRAFYQAGWFDMLGINTFESFAKMPEGSVLRIGPWSHGVDTFDKPEVNYEKLGGAVTEDAEIEFLRSALAGRESESKKWPGRILMYVMGRNEWRYENEWPLKRTVWRDYDFTGGETRSFAHDPKNPVPAKGGRIIHAGGQYDQREIEKRTDVLSYTGDVLTEDLEVTGDVSAKLVVSSTAASSDVTVKLVDVYPDGRAMNVLEGICRQTFKPGEKTKVEFFMDITSYVFLKGHKVRIDVAGSCAPHFQVNPNAAKITVHAGSKVVLPTIPAAVPRVDWVNVGSNSGRMGFDWQMAGTNGLNLAGCPQGTRRDFPKVKAHRAEIADGAYVIIPLCPFTSVVPPTYNNRPSADRNPLEGFDGEKTEKEHVEFRDMLDRCWKGEFTIVDYADPMTEKNRESYKLNVVYMREFLDWCTKEKLRPVLVLPPAEKSFDTLFPDSFMKAYILDFVKDLERPDVPFINYWKDPEFRSNRLWATSLFLNKTGRTAFTKRVIKDVTGKCK